MVNVLVVAAGGLVADRVCGRLESLAELGRQNLGKGLGAKILGPECHFCPCPTHL
jgi:hypothetical protein